MPQIRHKGTVFAGSPYDPLKHYVEEEDYEADKVYTEADIAKILGDIANSEESPALKSHGIGELILFEKKLYKVSAAIAIGDTLVDGTNIEETDIANEFAIVIEAITPVVRAGSVNVGSDKYAGGYVRLMKVGKIVYVTVHSLSFTDQTSGYVTHVCYLSTMNWWPLASAFSDVSFGGVSKNAGIINGEFHLQCHLAII